MAAVWPVGLRDRLDDLLQGGQPHLLLEKVARGGGMTRWWVVGTVADAEHVYREIRPGSRVLVVPVGDEVRLGRVGSGLAAELVGLAEATTEVVLGTAYGDSFEYDVTLLDPSEVEEATAELPLECRVLYGSWPQATVFAFTPSGDDGDVRPQPT